MTDTSITTPDTEFDWATRVLRQACAAADLDPADARLIKFTNNAVFALASAPIVVRIPGSAAVLQRVPKIIAVARWLARHGMPSVRLVEDLPQPLELAEHQVTFWHRVDTPSGVPQPDGTDLGRILRRYHTIAAPSFELPRWQPMAPIRQRIAEERVLAASDRHFLDDKCDEVDELLTEVEYRWPFGPVHGDGFVGNLIAGPQGAVICDFDSAAWGPREWDLTPAAVGQIRFGYSPNYHRQLSSEYGIDILEWPHFPVFRQLRELQLVTSVLPVLDANPSLYEQWRWRFTTFRDGETAARWSPYR